MGPTGAEDAADELYGAPPSEFVARRRELVRRAKAAGDKTLAATTAKLTRPTTSAWLVNLLVRRHTAELDELLEVGTALRNAQSKLAGDTLRELSARRRQLVENLVAAAVRLAADGGHVVSDSIGREIAETLDAAVADPAAAQAVHSGRLTRALSYAGFGPVDVTGSVAGAATARPSTGTPPGGLARQQELAAQRAATAERRRQESVRAARESLAEAERRAADRRVLLDQHQASTQAAREERDATVRRVAELEAQLARTRRDQSAAASAVATAERHLTRAEREFEQAERMASRARSELRRLEPEPG